MLYEALRIDQQAECQLSTGSIPGQRGSCGAPYWIHVRSAEWLGWRWQPTHVPCRVPSSRQSCPIQGPQCPTPVPCRAPSVPTPDPSVTPTLGDPPHLFHFLQCVVAAGVLDHGVYAGSWECQAGLSRPAMQRQGPREETGLDGISLCTLSPRPAHCGEAGLGWRTDCCSVGPPGSWAGQWWVRSRAGAWHGGECCPLGPLHSCLVAQCI